MFFSINFSKAKSSQSFLNIDLLLFCILKFFFTDFIEKQLHNHLHHIKNTQLYLGGQNRFVLVIKNSVSEEFYKYSTACSTSLFFFFNAFSSTTEVRPLYSSSLWSAMTPVTNAKCFACLQEPPKL